MKRDDHKHQAGLGLSDLKLGIKNIDRSCSGGGYLSLERLKLQGSRAHEHALQAELDKSDDPGDQRMWDAIQSANRQIDEAIKRFRDRCVRYG